MKNIVAAVDFGTSKIMTLVAKAGGLQPCDIIGAGTAAYDGFSEGRWNTSEHLNEAIAAAVRGAEDQSRVRIREVNVGVPADFSTVMTVEAKVELQGADPRVTQRDIDELFSRATNDLGTLRGSIIHRSPAWFVVDDGKKTLEPMGIHGYTLRAMVTFVVADQYFLEDVTERFRGMGIDVAGCFSAPVGEAMLFVPDEERDRTAILVDVGYLCTDVMAVEGDGLTFLKTIPVGGGHIAADLAYGLEVPLSSAEQIKRSYVYGLTAGQTTFECVGKDGSAKSFTREQVSNVLDSRADEICEAIRDTIKTSGVKLSSWSPIYLTGGGLAINRGGREKLAAVLNKPVRELPRKTVKMSSPAYSSTLGLMDLIIDTKANAKAAGGLASFFRSLFGG